MPNEYNPAEFVRVIGPSIRIPIIAAKSTPVVNSDWRRHFSHVSDVLYEADPVTGRIAGVLSDARPGSSSAFKGESTVSNSQPIGASTSERESVMNAARREWEAEPDLRKFCPELASYVNGTLIEKRLTSLSADERDKLSVSFDDSRGIKTIADREAVINRAGREWTADDSLRRVFTGRTQYVNGELLANGHRRLTPSEETAAVANDADRQAIINKAVAEWERESSLRKWTPELSAHVAGELAANRMAPLLPAEREKYGVVFSDRGSVKTLSEREAVMNSAAREYDGSPELRRMIGSRHRYINGQLLAEGHRGLTETERGSLHG